MGLREFVDGAGTRWLVWETVPERAGGLGEFAGGWLTFDDGTERRRLAPVPDGWAVLPDARLVLMLRLAAPPARRRGEAHRRPA